MFNACSGFTAALYLMFVCYFGPLGAMCSYLGIPYVIIPFKVLWNLKEIIEEKSYINNVSYSYLYWTPQLWGETGAMMTLEKVFGDGADTATHHIQKPPKTQKSMADTSGMFC